MKNAPFQNDENSMALFYVSYTVRFLNRPRCHDWETYFNKGDMTEDEI